MFGERSRGHEYEETTESSNLDQLSAKLVRVAVGFCSVFDTLSASLAGQ